METEPNPTPGPGPGRDLERETRNWATILHLSVLAGLVIAFAGLLAPVVIYLVKRDELPGLEPHSKVVFNWVISAIIYFAVGLILTVTLVGAILGIPLMLAVGVLSIVFPIIGGIKASEGEVWPYPLSIPIFK
ncbi:MAG: DUF4870 domain-containing protein [Wenzhouxiangella sp.]|nr:MAG: DUF4870 domain-containing protein [Wenzhouxiangella sp.]